MNYCVCGFPTREPSGFCRPCQRRMRELADAGPELGPWAAPDEPGECVVQTRFDEGWWCGECRRHHRPARLRRRRPTTNPRRADALETLHRRALRGGLQDKIRYVEELDRRGRGAEWREWLVLGQRLEMLQPRCQAMLDGVVGAEFETEYLEGLTRNQIWEDLYFWRPVRVRVVSADAHVDLGGRRVECHAVLEPLEGRTLVRNSAESGSEELADACSEFAATLALIDPEGRWWKGGFDNPDAPWLAKGLEPPAWA